MKTKYASSLIFLSILFLSFSTAAQAAQREPTNFSLEKSVLPESKVATEEAAIKDEISSSEQIELAPVSSNFSMVIMSDPQYNWGCKSDADSKNSDYCNTPKNLKKPIWQQANETNYNHIATIKALKNTLPNFFGVVINGDLTEYGYRNGNLEKFKKNYLALDTNVWPGLGNHDYQNNVNYLGKNGCVCECSGTKKNGTSKYNSCAANMTQFLVQHLKNNREIITRYDAKISENWGQKGYAKNVSGSLAYSFDKDNFHFVQLNNYPTYKVNFIRGQIKGINSWKIDINSPEKWVINDLNKAAAKGQRIILNWHKYRDIYANNEEQKAELIKMLEPYASSIKAIFVGHNHSMFGRNDTLTFPAVTMEVPAQGSRPAIPLRDSINIPVIYSGSAIYNRFIRADFISGEDQCQIVTQVINTLNGKPVNATNSDGTSGALTIDCNN